MGLSQMPLTSPDIAQNAGNEALSFKIFQGVMPPDPPSRPAGFSFWPAGLKLIENPAHSEK